MRNGIYSPASNQPVTPYAHSGTPLSDLSDTMAPGNVGGSWPAQPSVVSLLQRKHPVEVAGEDLLAHFQCGADLVEDRGLLLEDVFDPAARKK